MAMTGERVTLPTDEDGSADRRTFVLPLRFGSTAVDMPLTCFACVERMPKNNSVVYVEKADGDLVVALFKSGMWLNRHRRPLGFTPDFWFKLGGAD